MEEVIILPEVIDYIEELTQKLFLEEYFGFKENAHLYVENIYDFIYFDLKSFPSGISPEKLSYLDSKYIFYKANHNTTWYIFFENSDNRYLVTFITNNHSEIAKFL